MAVLVFLILCVVLYLVLRLLYRVWRRIGSPGALPLYVALSIYLRWIRRR